MESQEVFSQDAEEQRSSADMDRDTVRSHTTIGPVGQWTISNLMKTSCRFGVNIATHVGHKKRFVVHRRRGVASAASQRRRIVWTRLHSGTLLDPSTFRFFIVLHARWEAGHYLPVACWRA